MNGRRAIVGLCMLCALLVSAFAAQSASAVNGTTAVTCVKMTKAANQFTDSHCKTAGEGEFKHVAIAQDTTTVLSGSNNGEVEKLKTTIGGLAVTLAATGASGTGTIENRLGANGEHYVHGEGTVVFTGVTVEGFSGKCFAYEDLEGKVIGEKGKVDTEMLTATTLGQGDSIKLTPKEGGIFKRFWILDKNKKTSAEGGECSIGATYVCSGSVIGVPEGATGRMTHASMTTQNTLKMGPTEAGSKAGIEGTVTLEGKDPKVEGDIFKPLSTTTVAT